MRAVCVSSDVEMCWRRRRECRVRLRDVSWTSEVQTPQQRQASRPLCSLAYGPALPTHAHTHTHRHTHACTHAYATHLTCSSRLSLPPPIQALAAERARIFEERRAKQEASESAEAGLSNRDKASARKTRRQYVVIVVVVVVAVAVLRLLYSAHVCKSRAFVQYGVGWFGSPRPDTHKRTNAHAYTHTHAQMHTVSSLCNCLTVVLLFQVLHHDAGAREEV